MTPREIALSICEPWFNGDPCEGCECHKVCTKLVERIEDAIKTDREWLEAKAQSYKNFALALQSERDRSADTGKTSDHIADVSKMVDQSEDALGMVASVREDRTVEATSQESRQVEPIGYANKKGLFRCADDADEAFKATAIPLYATPPKREPMTEQQLDDMFDQAEIAIYLADRQRAEHLEVYSFGVRDAEKWHGIGGEE